MKIENRIVVIAGGSSGIGLGTAHALAERGAGRIVLLARQQGKLDAAAAAVHRQHGTVVSVFRPIWAAQQRFRRLPPKS